MNLVDSSGLLEYFSGGNNADEFSKPLDNIESVIVPTICIYEMFKVVLREKDEDSAIKSIASMKQGNIVDLTMKISIQSAKFSLNNNIPMADSIIYTTGRMYNATIWTQDSDFRKLDNVKYFPS